MSQRIADSLEVLDLIHQLAQQNPDKPARYCRNEAIAHVASRGVTTETVYAGLVGKDTAYTLDANEIDQLVTT